MNILTDNIITTNDIVNLKLENNRTESDADIIQDLIDSHDTTDMQTGVDYYNNQNEILDRELYYYDEDGNKVIDTSKTDNKLPHGYHKILVDQKVNYLFGKPITFDSNVTDTDEEGNEINPLADYIDKINELLGEQFDDDINELATEASNKGAEWLHPYIDDNGEFDYIIVDHMEFIPVWETSKQKELSTGIRYYLVNHNGEDKIRVEWWDKKQVTYYIEDNGVFVLDDTVEINPAGHFEYNGKSYGWEKVPFVLFPNNKDMRSDLYQYKELIDDYDKNTSNTSNDLDEIQEALIVVKNYSGTNAGQAKQNLRYHKLVLVDGDGGIDKLTIDIPTEAKKQHLDRLDDDIYTFGQGVNPKTDRFGNNPTGVALKFMYQLLDLKADQMERKFKRAIREFLWFVTEYINISERKDYNYNDVNITVNRSMLTNEAEKIESATRSKGVISDKTIVANHPWVDDPQQEIEQIEQENEADILPGRIDTEIGALEQENEGIEL